MAWIKSTDKLPPIGHIVLVKMNPESDIIYLSQLGYDCEDKCYDCKAPLKVWKGTTSLDWFERTVNDESYWMEVPDCLKGFPVFTRIEK